MRKHKEAEDITGGKYQIEQEGEEYGETDIRSPGPSKRLKSGEKYGSVRRIWGH